MNNDRTIKIILILLGDLVLLWAALLAALMIRYWPELKWEFIDLHITPFTFIFAAWLVLFGAFGLYDIRIMKNDKRLLYRLLRAMATNTVLTIFVFYLVPFFELEPRRNLIIIATVTTIFILLWRFLFNLLIIRASASRVLFFGGDRESVELAGYLLKNPQLGQKPIAFMSLQNPVRNTEWYHSDAESFPSGTFRGATLETAKISNGAGGGGNADTLGLPHFTKTADLRHIAIDFSIDTIVISHEIKENKALVQTLFQVVPLGISVIEFTKFHEMLTGKIPLSLIGEVWFLENLVGTKSPLYEFFKRGVDIIVALILGIPTLALLPFIALAIIMSAPEDVFSYKTRRARRGDGLLLFRQKRVGKNGKAFGFIKFRSYVLGAENMHEAKEVANDKRQYAVGNFLRKSYLDELPQIWNILKGEMSFVGPRPERPEYVAQLKQKIPFYEMRLLVPPGITGWAQVNMEDDASVEDAPAKMQYDLYYIKNRSFILDLLILLRTVAAILRRQGR